MRHLTISLAVFSALTLLAPGGAFAQEDTAPPVLLDFSITPAIFDAGLGPVTLTACATAEDDLSGLSVAAGSMGGLPTPTNTGGPDFRFDPNGPLQQTLCVEVVAAQFAPYGTYDLSLNVRDAVNNIRLFSADGSLCAIGTCQLVNWPASDLPDADMDGVPDDTDNCPDDPNSNQEDMDLDLIGDECDPFPLDRDNEQAQCEVDRDQALADLDECLATPPFTDTDSDGEGDSTDASSQGEYL